MKLLLALLAVKVIRGKNRPCKTVFCSPTRIVVTNPQTGEVVTIETSDSQNRNGA